MAACTRWRSAPTASCWPAPAPTAPYGYGTRPPVATHHATIPRWGGWDVAFSPDGKLLASGAFDGTLRAWNPATGQRVGPALQTGNGPLGGLFSVAFSPNG